MAKFDSGDSNSIREFYGRLKYRLREGPDEVLAQAWSILRTLSHHAQRIELARVRYLRAIQQRSKICASYEHEVIHILMYEAADTIFMTVVVLDLNRLALHASADGFGLTGESAAGVIELLSSLEQQCQRILAWEKEFGLKLDFQQALDEKEGVTFMVHRHWQDFVPGSVEQSFHEYFRSERRAIHEHIRRQPTFWPHQTIGRYLESKGYLGLLAVLRRLEFVVPAPAMAV